MANRWDKAVEPPLLCTVRGLGKECTFTQVVNLLREDGIKITEAEFTKEFKRCHGHLPPLPTPLKPTPKRVLNHTPKAPIPPPVVTPPAPELEPPSSTPRRKEKVAPKPRPATLNDLVLAVAQTFTDPFTLADLAVACWCEYPARFSLPGYPKYPSERRVACVIFGARGLIDAGALVRVGEKYLAKE